MSRCMTKRTSGLSISIPNAMGIPYQAFAGSGETGLQPARATLPSARSTRHGPGTLPPCPPLVRTGPPTSLDPPAARPCPSADAKTAFEFPILQVRRPRVIV